MLSQNGLIPSRNSNFKISYCDNISEGICEGIRTLGIITNIHNFQILTISLHQTLISCDYSFSLKKFKIPQRVLTFPNEGVKNEGFDNIDDEYILKVHDTIQQKKKNESYLIEDLIGKGTFGQVARCFRQSDGKRFAIKIIKNIQVYNYQALKEIKTLIQINQYEEKQQNNTSRIVKLIDQFIHQNHVCLVFPLHHISLYEFLQETKFEGFQMSLIKKILKEIVEGIEKIHKLKQIHCDLKPENILLTSKDNHSIKIIDLGSAEAHDCENSYFEYIQSLFYRAPEIIIGLPKTPAIDMWSIGCIAVELYLGQPLFAAHKNTLIDGNVFKNYLIQKQSNPNSDIELILQGSKATKFLSFDATKNNLINVKSKEEFEDDEGCVLPPQNKQLYAFQSFEDLRKEFDKSSFRCAECNIVKI